jgi:L-threonylcarbamoyladenylate synthase
MRTPGNRPEKVFEGDLNEALTVLKNGGVIVYPTDTIWGLGCDATNPSAVEKIFSIKSRSGSKSLLILVDSEAMLGRYVKEIPEVVYELTAVSDKPMTIIYPSGKNLAPGICNEDGSVGIRICSDEFCCELIRRFRKPLVSTSANLSGKPSPAFFSEIEKSIIEAADYTIKYRRDDRSSAGASSVIKVELNGTIKIIRM